MSSNDLSDHQAGDRDKALKSISALYAQGQTKDAYDLLDALLRQHPDDTELRLPKAEWSLERRQQAAYIGQTVAKLRGELRTSLRERRVIADAVSWAEEACAGARQALAAERPDVALREYCTACEL